MPRLVCEGPWQQALPHSKTQSKLGGISHDEYVTRLHVKDGIYRHLRARLPLCGVRAGVRGPRIRPLPLGYGSVLGSSDIYVLAGRVRGCLLHARRTGTLRLYRDPALLLPLDDNMCSRAGRAKQKYGSRNQERHCRAQAWITVSLSAATRARRAALLNSAYV